MITSALLAGLDLVDGAAPEVDALLVDVVEALSRQDGVVCVASLELGPSRRAVFSAYSEESSREAQIRSEGQAMLLARARSLFVEPPRLQRLEVLANKMPSREDTPITVGAIGWMRGHRRVDPALEDLVRSVRPYVEDDPAAVAWFALHDETGAYGTVALLVDDAARETSLAGRAWEELRQGAAASAASAWEVCRFGVLAHRMVAYRNTPGS